MIFPKNLNFLNMTNNLGWRKKKYRIFIFMLCELFLHGTKSNLNTINRTFNGNTHTGIVIDTVNLLVTIIIITK